ncbi:MAG: transferase hexapeptide repeat family protein [Deltaproteobacteria bacterium]|nr:transferase hexapeptide repeat family protein [Deltaproteobacteria bacterium]
MPKTYSLDGKAPVIDPKAFVHPEAVLIGDVVVGPGCYIGPCACLRGDFGPIRLEAGAAVQDTCVIHTFPGQEARIETGGLLGHGAVIHGCIIKKNAMVGINAVVLDRAVVGENSLVAAGALVPAGLEIPAGRLVAGVPAKVVRPLTEEEIKKKLEGIRLYQTLAVRSLQTMRPVEP